MPIDRDSFDEHFTTYEIPDWNCSTCHRGKLLFDAKKVIIHETNESAKERDNKNWEPFWIEQHFHGRITCDNPKCKEVFTISGRVNVEEDYNEDNEQIYTDCYYTEYIFPTLHIFKIPEDTPSDVEEAIVSAFKVFWIDKSASANSIRKTIEIILNDKRVLRTELTKNKKRRNLSLHERIELFDKKNTEVANYLMAIKWIGNAGSHVGEITNEDLLDGFDLLKYSIEKLYAFHDKEIAEMTKRINKRRKS